MCTMGSRMATGVGALVGHPQARSVALCLSIRLLVSRSPSVRLSVCQPVSHIVHMSGCACVYISFCLCLSLCPSVCRSASSCLFVYLSVCLSFCVSISACHPLCLFVGLSICLSLRPSVCRSLTQALSAGQEAINGINWEHWKFQTWREKM